MQLGIQHNTAEDVKRAETGAYGLDSMEYKNKEAMARRYVTGPRRSEH